MSASPKVTEDRIEIVEHPNWYYPVEGMRTLILGTFPPHPKKWNFNFYYPNNQNRFWRVLAEIARTPLSYRNGDDAVKERKELMRQLKVGVQNIGHTIERKNGSAADKDIKILTYQDLTEILQQNDSLENILLTGFSSSTNTYKDFLKLLDQQGIRYSSPTGTKVGSTFEIFTPKKVKVVIVNSTSSANLKTGVTLEVLVAEFEKWIRP